MNRCNPARWLRGPALAGLLLAAATAELDLGDDAKFWPSDEALARWKSIAEGGRASIVYD